MSKRLRDVPVQPVPTPEPTTIVVPDDEADDMATPYVPSDADEPPELEVQQLLESRDAERAAAEAVAAVVPVACTRCGGSGYEPEGASVPEPPHGPHALDSAPLNSKIVVVLIAGKSHAVLATHEGAKELPAGDIAHRLPEGARIFKQAEDQYRAEQLSPTVDHPPLVCTTAGECIARFVGHFHG